MAQSPIDQAIHQAEQAQDTYEVPSENLPALQEKFAKLAARAVKLGCPVPTLTVVEHYTVDRRYEGFVRTYHYDLVRVDGVAPSYNGWTFVATLEHTPTDDNGPITVVRTVPGQTIPESYRTASSTWCDHCRTNRVRRDTYVVRHESGELKQVGSSCLKDFLGHASPQHLAAQASWLAGLREVVGGFTGDLVDDRYIDLGDLIGWAAGAIRRHGWVSRTKARESVGYVTATADVALYSKLAFEKAGGQIGGGPVYDSERQELWQPTARDWADAEEAVSWAREHLASKSDLGDYEHNLYAVVRQDTINRRSVGIAASVVTYWERENSRAQEQAEQAKAREASGIVSNWIGQVGGKVDVVARVEFVKHIQSDWGASHLTKFVDGQGNRVVWFAKEKLEVGQSYRLVGTVKGHGEYQGIKETMLTRAKATSLPLAA